MREQEIEIRFNLMLVIYKPIFPITVLGNKKMLGKFNWLKVRPEGGM